jgi:hypothetical protein
MAEEQEVDKVVVEGQELLSLIFKMQFLWDFSNTVSGELGGPNTA